MLSKFSVVRSRSSTDWSGVFDLRRASSFSNCLISCFDCLVNSGKIDDKEGLRTIRTGAGTCRLMMRVDLDRPCNRGLFVASTVEEKNVESLLNILH